jgi:uncharacterized protein
MTKLLVLALALAAASTVQAQTPPAASAAAKPASPAASRPAISPVKAALVAKVLQLQQPAIEAMARQLAEQPAVQMLQQANTAMQRVPPEQREAVARDIQAEARKYAAEATPLVQERAVKLAPSTVGALLDDRFTEAELKQLVALLESPVNRKFQESAGDMQRALGEKLVAETRPLIEPRVRALEQAIVRRLDSAAPAASAPKK